KILQACLAMHMDPILPTLVAAIALAYSTARPSQV
ncbi:MAG: hypothetical protein ACJAVJ_001454, partial [Planctomycetota bacterium]